MLNPRPFYESRDAAFIAYQGFIHYAEIVETGNPAASLIAETSLGETGRDMPRDNDLDLDRYTHWQRTAATARESVQFGLLVAEVAAAASAARGAISARFGRGEAAGAVVDAVGDTPVVESEPGVIPETAATAIPASAGQPATVAAEHELNAVVEELGGPPEGYTVRICDNSTWEGRRALFAGGAQVNVGTRTIWVHESVVRLNGVLRKDWNEWLSLRQVVAHEIGHVEKGTFDCALASRAGADIGLPQAERLGLLRDAAQIAKQKGIPLEDLKFPPGFLLKKPPK